MIEKIKPNIECKNKNSASYLRHKDIIERIQGNEDFQFVFADYVLAAIYSDIKPKKIVNICFCDDDCALLHFVDCTKSNTGMYAYSNINLK